MANERMYLYCKHCGARLYMGKHSYGIMHFSNDEVMNNFGRKLQKFYKDHYYCHGSLSETSFLSGYNDPKYESDYSEVYDFGIVYESSGIYPLLCKFNVSETY